MKIYITNNILNKLIDDSEISVFAYPTDSEDEIIGLTNHIEGKGYGIYLICLTKNDAEELSIYSYTELDNFVEATMIETSITNIENKEEPIEIYITEKDVDIELDIYSLDKYKSINITNKNHEFTLYYSVNDDSTITNLSLNIKDIKSDKDFYYKIINKIQTGE